MGSKAATKRCIPKYIYLEKQLRELLNKKALSSQDKTIRKLV